MERRRPPRADPTRIAVLEYELLYIRPERGSTADEAVEAAIEAGETPRQKFCLGCGRIYRPQEEWCSVCTVCPEHGNLCSRPLPGEFDCPNALAVLSRRMA